MSCVYVILTSLLTGSSRLIKRARPSGIGIFFLWAICEISNRQKMYGLFLRSKTPGDSSLFIFRPAVSMMMPFGHHVLRRRLSQEENKTQYIPKCAALARTFIDR